MTFGELSEGGRGEDRRLEQRRRSGVGRAVQVTTASPGINGGGGGRPLNRVRVSGVTAMVNSHELLQDIGGGGSGLDSDVVGPLPQPWWPTGDGRSRRGADRGRSFRSMTGGERSSQTNKLLISKRPKKRSSRKKMLLITRPNVWTSRVKAALKNTL
jgi:hypothetical protein